MQSQKNMIKKHIGKLLITIGCSLILIVLFLRGYTHYKKNELIRSYNQSVKMQKEIVEQTEEPEQTKEPEQTGKEAVLPLNQKILGVLEIPKIDLQVAIAEGVGEEVLKYAVGHFEDTAMPGEKGNACMVGHRNYVCGEFFNRLGEIKLGDQIFV